MKATSYVLVAPFTPGARPSEVEERATLREIRKVARLWADRRPDLRRGIDLRIERCIGPRSGSRDKPDGRERRLVEYF